MSLKAKDVDKVFNKFDMRVKNGKDRYALFYYEGRLILRTKRSLGKHKIDNKVRYLIRQQLKLSDTEFSQAIDCTLGRPDYVKILKNKGLISN